MSDTKEKLERVNGRKWLMFKWRFAIDLIVLLAAVGMAFVKDTPAQAFAIAGFADMATNFATYFAANVLQKNVISKHYRPELDDRLVESADIQNNGGSV